MTLLIGITAAPAAPPAAQKDLPVPDFACLHEGFKWWYPTFSVACSQADLIQWASNRGTTLSMLSPVPPVLPDGSLAQGTYRAPNGDLALFARFAGDTFLPIPYRTRAEVRAVYLASMGVDEVLAASPPTLAAAPGPCDPVFGMALLGTVPTAFSGSVRLYRQCATNPSGPYSGKSILYTEGHGGSFLDTGADFVQWLSSLGFDVYLADMPLYGTNQGDPAALVLDHEDYVLHERAPVSPLWTEMLAPQMAIIDFIRARSSGPLGVAGRSGGAMLANGIGTIHPSVDYVLSIASATPHSMRLGSVFGPFDLGDWEQWSPRTYAVVGHEELIRSAGRLGGVFAFSGQDPCCFRVAPGDGFYEWVTVPPSDGRTIALAVDPAHADHSLSEAQKPAVLAFLDGVMSAPHLAVTLAGSGQGFVTSSPDAIDCLSACGATFAPGTQVTLTATAEGPASVFAGWSGACTGTGACVVTMNASMSVIATFNIATMPLTIEKAGTGTGLVASTPAGIECGATCATNFALGTLVTLTASPDSGSVFQGWSGACSGVSACAVTMDAAKSLTATFGALNTLTVTKSGAGSGSVSSSPAGIDCGSVCAASFVMGENVALTATPAVNSIFDGWSGACTGTGACVVTVDAAKSVSATFSLTQLGLAIAKAGNGAGNVTSSPAGLDCGAACFRVFEPGTMVTLTATSDPNHIFGGWTGGGCSGTGPCVVTLLAATQVTAAFIDPPATVRLANLSTRGQVLSGSDVLISGFVIGGNQPKTIVMTVAGPSLIDHGVTSPLMNPMITLVRMSDNTVIGNNDDWQFQTNPQDLARIQASGFAPANAFEPAIIATLPPGAYTAIVQGVGVTATGIGLVGLYEVDNPHMPLINISTRGQVRTGNNAMIAGFIIHGIGEQRVVITVAGPSLSGAGIPNPLANPHLTIVRSSDGAVIATNDNWQVQADPSHVGLIQSVGFAPANSLEPAVYLSLPPGAYTAIVQGVGGIGVGLVGVYAVQ
ncbi:InlB B-repeat-containing protein [Usitatibacter palustris]|uniref:InlB B-repeat-containing protein n=1 Tax=Usitatibacter palustris TaxID=2732487 RepID=UPI001BB20441|nr:hypothetical protein [Usitatibacter palustris]